MKHAGHIHTDMRTLDEWALDVEMRMLMQGEDATVTVVHSKTKDAREICAEADILIAAIGKAEMVRADWVKPGAAVIDVGTNPIPVRPHHLRTPVILRHHPLGHSPGLQSCSGWCQLL